MTESEEPRVDFILLTSKELFLGTEGLHRSNGYNCVELPKLRAIRNFPVQDASRHSVLPASFRLFSGQSDAKASRSMLSQSSQHRPPTTADIQYAIVGS